MFHSQATSKLKKEAEKNILIFNKILLNDSSHLSFSIWLFIVYFLINRTGSF